MKTYCIQLLRNIFVPLLLAAPLTATAAPAIIDDVQVVPQAGFVRVIFHIDHPSQSEVFTLDNPQRVVVDIEEGSLHANLHRLNLPAVFFKRVRSAMWKPGILRVVFDMQSAAQAKSGLHVDDNEKQGKLVVDIYPTSHQIASQLVAEPVLETKHTPKPLPPKKAAPAKPTPRATEPPAKAVSPIVQTPTMPMPVATIAPVIPKLHSPQVSEPKPHQLIVVIDAGHGGKDSGTVGRRGTLEKDIVLATAVRLAELINQQPTMHAVLTRKGDYFVSLKQRLAITRTSKPDLFIAIHADSFFDNQSTGASVYALSAHGASSAAARWLANKENNSELGGVDLNDTSYELRSVLIDLAQTATIADSIKLGSDILASLETVTPLHNRHVDQAPFMVLKSPDISSVLVETGFLSNPSEEDRLRETTYRDKLANALLAGIRHYADMHPLLSGAAPTQRTEPTTS